MPISNRRGRRPRPDRREQHRTTRRSHRQPPPDVRSSAPSGDDRCVKDQERNGKGLCDSRRNSTTTADAETDESESPFLRFLLVQRSGGVGGKPNSVIRPEAGGDHSSGRPVARPLDAPYPQLKRDGPPLAAYLGLLAVGFALPARSPATRCALTAPFHPYRSRHCRDRTRRAKLERGTPAVYFLWHFPSAHAGWPLATTVPCPVRTFLPGRERGSGSFCAKHPQGRSGKMNLAPFPPERPPRPLHRWLLYRNPCADATKARIAARVPFTHATPACQDISGEHMLSSLIRDHSLPGAMHVRPDALPDESVLDPGTMLGSAAGLPVQAATAQPPPARPGRFCSISASRWHWPPGRSSPGWTRRRTTGRSS